MTTTIKYDTELAVRAMLPAVRRRLAGFELKTDLTDEELVAKLTDTLTPIVRNARVPSDAPKAAAK